MTSLEEQPRDIQDIKTDIDTDISRCQSVMEPDDTSTNDTLTQLGCHKVPYWIAPGDVDTTRTCWNECKVCCTQCDEHGNFAHSKGCYVKGPEGGGYTKCYCTCHTRLTRRERARAKEQSRKGLQTPLMAAAEAEREAICLSCLIPRTSTSGEII